MRKIKINWNILRFHPDFKKTGEVKTKTGNLSIYKRFSKDGISIKICGNYVRISPSKAIFQRYKSNKKLYTMLVDAIVYLYEEKILLSGDINFRNKAYRIMRTRGIIRIEHAIDVFGMATSMAQRGIDIKGKRYYREKADMTRFEVILKGSINQYRDALKAKNPIIAIMPEIIKKHALNLLNKAHTATLSGLIGVGLGKTKRINLGHLRRWIEATIRQHDLEYITDPMELKRLAGLEHQNII